MSKPSAKTYELPEENADETVRLAVIERLPWIRRQ